MTLLKIAKLAHYPAEETIFKQGDYGDMMYVILKGSVNVRVKRPTPFGTVEDIISAVLYDGSHFGDYALMGTSQKNSKKSEGEFAV